MSARRRRKRRGLIGAIVADPYRKLAAIALAIGLWYYLDNQVHEEQKVTVVLTTPGIERQDSIKHELTVQLGNDQYVGRRFVAGDEPRRTVDLYLRGPKAKVRDVLGSSPGGQDAEKLEFPVRIDGRSLTGDVDVVEFTDVNIQRLSNLQGLEITKMEPARVRLEVYRKVARALLLELDLVEIQADEKLRARFLPGKERFAPPEVNLVGSATTINRFFDQLKTEGFRPFLANLSETAGEPSATGKVELGLGPDSDLRLEQEAVNLSIPLSAQGQELSLNVELPLIIDDKALPEQWRGKYHARDDRDGKRLVATKVNFYGPLRDELRNRDPEYQQQWVEDYLRLYVALPPLPEGREPDADYPALARLLLNPQTVTRNPDDCTLASTPTITLILEK